MLFEFIDTSKEITKDNIVDLVQHILYKNKLQILSQIDKPWGAELKIKEENSFDFFRIMFKTDCEFLGAVKAQPFGPKILIIENSKRLSWHVHERKDAFLQILKGTLNVYTNTTDDEVVPKVIHMESTIHIPEQIRHRLESINGWAIVAEVSRNVFPDHPSNDEDERRIKDDFGRI